MSTPFKVQRIDHVELFVPDRHEAAAWYQRVLGLEVILACRVWAEDSEGPLMISPDGGVTKLALFAGSRSGASYGEGFHRVAFSTDAAGFMDFVGRFPELNLPGSKNAEFVVDHGLAYSVYFEDPWGHRLEVTTYDYEEVTALLARRPARS